MGSGETILTGPLADQTALHGVLIKIRDLGLPLLGLSRIEPERENESLLLMHPEEEERDRKTRLFDTCGGITD